ncbi:MAG: glycosyltransferase family 32 protein [Bacteroidales bacterium]
MLNHNFHTPVLFIVFNRPETTFRVFEQIRKAKPLRLYVAADGPRNELDRPLCENIRKIVEKVDWTCEVKTLFQTQNLGCREAGPTAIRWFFEHETEGIVLEDDCLPADDFFGFCSAMLERYRDDHRIGDISGGNYQFVNVRGDGSYFFSALSHVWGWAGWRRVWREYDLSISTFPSFKEGGYIDKMSSHAPFRNYWLNMFRVHHEGANGWDFQYAYLNLINNRLSIIPNVNLITNIGCDNVEATHYQSNHPFANIPLGKMNEIKHPTFVVADVEADLFSQQIETLRFNRPDQSNGTYSFIKDRLLEVGRSPNLYMQIPQIIHQIYEDPEGPSELLRTVAESWKEQNPNWEYRFWNKATIDSFLESEFPEFEPIYRAYPYNVQRWDAIRYLILYRYGGLYVDMDYECLESIAPLLGSSTCCMGLEPVMNARRYNKPYIVGNAFMACIPGHGYFKSLIESLIEECEIQWNTNKAFQIIESTGPFFTTRVYDKYPNREDIVLLSDDLVAPLTMEEVRQMISGDVTSEIEERVEKAFAIHYFLGSWLDQTKDGEPLKVKAKK